MHTWTRTAAPEQQVLILRSTAYQAWILGLSSTIGGRFCGPLAGQKQPASGPGGRCIASNSFTIWADQRASCRTLRDAPPPSTGRRRDMTGESAELEMVNIRVRRRAGAAPDMHPWPAGPRFRSSKGVLEKDLLYPGSACFGFHTVGLEEKISAGGLEKSLGLWP